MKFGLFYELQLPRPWAPDDEYDLYKNTLDQIELADSLGFDYIWSVEHHFLEEYSHCSAPELFLTAAAAQTRFRQPASRARERTVFIRTSRNPEGGRVPRHASPRVTIATQPR